jgi:hypothetical protein
MKAVPGWAGHKTVVGEKTIVARDVTVCLGKPVAIVD